MIAPALKQSVAEAISEDASGFTESSAMAAAIKPVMIDPNTKTAKDAAKTGLEFRMRQYVTGYLERGERNAACDRLALGFLTNWIACHYNGTVDTNLPTLAAMSNELANNPACTDPLVLTVAAVNTEELHEAIRRLESALKGFQNSKHLAYPKFYAAIFLGDKLIHDKADRLPVLDAQALQYLQAALTDGSIRPEDQAEIAEILILGWGNGFFDRNDEAVCALVQAQGKPYQWLALVLQGEREISAAWRARGGGYVNTVSESGWKGFNQHLASARKYFTQAWKLHPDRPLAPCRMIYVSLGDANIGEMRVWFDRTVAAQIDYPNAWSNLRWGLRPRWYGDLNSMLAFGQTALNTRRFDTDVPRKYFDSVSDVTSELEVPSGQNIYGRADIWPQLETMYEGYIAEPTLTEYSRDGWRNAYAMVAYLAGKYAVAQKQLQALKWQSRPEDLLGWGKDVSLMPLEVAARTGTQAKPVSAAETDRLKGDVAGALKIYNELAAATDLDGWTRGFVQERQATLKLEQALQSGSWVNFLPADTNFTGWQAASGKYELLPDGALEVQSASTGHILYSRARVGTEFEVRGQFEVVGSGTKEFQAGLVMGVPEFDTANWYGFRMKRNSDEGEVCSFSRHWSSRQIKAPVQLDGRTNTFSFRFQAGRVSATVDGREVFREVEPPKNSYVSTNEFLLGLGAFNHSNDSAIRYRNLQVRRLTSK
jgi:hypothetical protein